MTLPDSSVHGNRVSDELVYLNLGRGMILYMCYVFTKGERKNFGIVELNLTTCIQLCQRIFGSLY